MTQRAIHAHITGRVQGVNYRHATLHHAHKWGIKGWVRNLPDGRVELQAYSDHDAIDKLLKWLHRGPSLAKVTEVQVQDIPWEDHEGFEVRR